MAISDTQPSPPSGADAVHAQAERLFAQGLQCHSDGELAQAMQTYEQVLKLAPGHFGALHHVGIVAFQVGNFALAAGFFRSALAVDPDAAAVHGDLGNALREMQHLEDALLSYERALALNGGDADTYFNRGVALQALQRPDDALRSYDRALAINEADDQAWSNRAAVLGQMRQHAAALRSVEQALAVNPQNVEAHHNHGTILRESGRMDEAEASYRRALELVPDYAEAQHQLGRLLYSRGQAEEALQCHDRTIALDPRRAEAYRQRAIVLRKLDRITEAQRDDASAAGLRRELIDAHRTLGKELQELGRPESAARLFGAALALDDGDADLWQLRARMLNAAARREEALAAVERALALRPDSADYHLTRGVILRAMLRYEEARQCFENVVRLAPHHPGGYTNLGSLLDQLGDAGAALENCARAIALDPDCALAHWNRALVYLRCGDYERGWREYEWRWKAETLSLHNSRRHFPQPAWTGREALSGKTILLHAEQGLGDTLQFCRYATLVAQRGATVIVEAPPPLAELLGTLAGVDRVVARDAAPPPFDYHIPLMSLPLAFGTRPDTVPGAPYLASDPARVARWDALLGPRTRPRVGVVWSGHPAHLNDHHRSVPLALMARLFAGPLAERCEFISLQKEVRPADQPLLDTLPLRQVAGQLRDFSDTAALCALLDVVVTVDTSVAHLAGALGKPVWILLPAPFEWRWLEQGAASPWYPSATLYRQSRRCDWAPVIDAVAADLGQLAADSVAGLIRWERRQR